MAQRRMKQQVHLRIQPNAIALAKIVNHGVPLSKRAGDEAQPERSVLAAGGLVRAG